MGALSGAPIDFLMAPNSKKNKMQLPMPNRSPRSDGFRKKGIAIVLFFCFLLGACTSQFAPPAAPVEIPGFVTFPSSLTVDISEIDAKTGSDPTTIGVASGGDYSEIIVAGTDLMNSVNDFNDVILTLFEGISVPVSNETVTYERTLADNPDRNPLKIDFRDFDLDGNGVDEGCTGCTCPVGCEEECPDEAELEELLPVCYRVWVDDNHTGDFAPFMGGVLGRFPSGTNPGEGRYRAFASTTTEDDATVASFVGVVYDHIDAEDSAAKSIDVSLRQLVLDEEDALVLYNDIHGVTAQETREDDEEGDEVRKQVAVDFVQVDSAATILDYLEYAARFMDDGFFWRGTIDSFSGYQFTNLCVDLRTGNEADVTTEEALAECDKIDVTGFAASPLNSADVSFPDDFPDSPTF